MNGKNRSYLMGVVGGYLLYLAYQLLPKAEDPETTMSPALRILFIVFFSLAGIGLLVYAVILWRAGAREEKENPEQKPPENEDSLK